MEDSSEIGFTEATVESSGDPDPRKVTEHPKKLLKRLRHLNPLLYHDPEHVPDTFNISAKIWINTKLPFSPLLGSWENLAC